MIGSRFIASNHLDAPVAALAGLSVAFLAFAMPGDLLTDLVDSTGLAALLPEGEPPFGLRARIGLGAAGAIAIFAIAFGLLRWLGRIGRNRAARSPEPRLPGDPPRLRRRDHHPDAPARAPLAAGRELGEPAPEVLSTETQQTDLPAWMSEVDEEEPVDLAAFVVDPLDPSAFEMPAPAPAPAVARSVASRPSLDDLMARLETGLTRRRAPTRSDYVRSAPANGADPHVFPEIADDRLQSAIDSLHRFTSRQN